MGKLQVLLNFVEKCYFCKKAIYFAVCITATKLVVSKHVPLTDNAPQTSNTSSHVWLFHL